jgi:hypothetical protein
VPNGPGRLGALAALKRGRCLVAREKTDLSGEELDKLLDARKMTEA